MPDFHNQRILTATPAQVFACLRDPERLARWWGPEGFTNTFEVFEFVPGGRWVFTMHGPDGKDYPNESTFGDLEENARVVVHHVVEPRFVLEIALHAEGSGTRVEWLMDFENKDFARNLKDFLQTANEQNLDRLAAELARGKDDRTMKQHYFLKLLPPRPTFMQDMTAEEREVMGRHVAYLAEQMSKGVVQVFGPVLDPQGPFGVAVISVESDAERDALIANDPANGLNRYEFHPMKAVLPSV